MDKEIWKDIPGYEGHYKASSLGRIKSIPRYVSNHTGQLLVKEKIISQRKNEKGYMICYLSKNAKDECFRVHRLIAKTFIPNPENKPQVNHIDGNKSNNRLENLEWCTNSENQIHAFKNGLNYVTGRAGKPKRKVEQIDMNTNCVIKVFESIAQAQRETNSKNIGMCCRGERNFANGYKWRYA